MLLSCMCNMPLIRNKMLNTSLSYFRYKPILTNLRSIIVDHYLHSKRVTNSQVALSLSLKVNGDKLQQRLPA